MKHRTRPLHFFAAVWVFILSAAAITLGAGMVNVRCHNTMYTDKIRYFGIYPHPNGCTIEFSGHLYDIVI